MIGIVDYGLGNVLSFFNLYKKLSVPVCVCQTPADLKKVRRLVLPGVGSFDWAMSRLNRSGMREALDEHVLGHDTPVIGICVGMQMMAKRSDEGEMNGLGWIDADIHRFEESRFQQATPLPHLGWNDVEPVKQTPLFDGLENNSRFYFLHSYFFSHKEEQILAQTEYGGFFASAVNNKNIYGVQFHPEKSHHWGVRLLNNFAKNC